MKELFELVEVCVPINESSRVLCGKCALSWEECKEAAYRGEDDRCCVLCEEVKGGCDKGNKDRCFILKRVAT